MRPSALVTAFSILLGCAPATGPQPTAAGGVDRLSGEWRATFTRHRVSEPVSQGRIVGAGRPVADSLRSVEGTITFVPPDERGGRAPWRGASSVNLAELLGRPLACYAVGSALVHVERYERELTLHWPANVADCGIAMVGQYRADTIVGDWTEVSFSGPVTLGRFRLVRVQE